MPTPDPVSDPKNPGDAEISALYAELHAAAGDAERRPGILSRLRAAQHAEAERCGAEIDRRRHLKPGTGRRLDERIATLERLYADPQLGDVRCDDASSLPPCAPDIYQKGVAILTFCGPRPNLIEEWLERTVRRLGLRVDFHLMAGHWVVRALPEDTDAAEEALLAGLDCLEKAAVRYRNNFPDDEIASPVTGVRFPRWVDEE